MHYVVEIHPSCFYNILLSRKESFPLKNFTHMHQVLQSFPERNKGCMMITPDGRTAPEGQACSLGNSTQGL